MKMARAAIMPSPPLAIAIAVGNDVGCYEFTTCPES